MIRTILKSLLKPEAYPEPTHSVELIQTHVSWIFLTDNYAYKVKKPVDFGFLNFTTIDRRRFYCNEEVRLNRRLCPDIYEGVVELRETSSGAAFHGNGPIIDFAVRMKRLPADRMLDRLLAKGEISATEIRQVAGVIADFHLKAVTAPAIAEYGQLDRIMFNWQENFEQMSGFEDSTLPAEEREYIRNWVSSFAGEQAGLFKERVEQGFIRECDGDIHLENICLVDGRVYIFDCIEFNERFRYCDTAADVAFLLMDLDFHHRKDLADQAMATYLELTADKDMPALVDFYKIYRAFVRGKVESFRLNDSCIDQPEVDQARLKAILYFRLARGYVERRRLKPTLFITCGLMGCGKSTLAAQLSFELGINSFNSDVSRKKIAGLPPTPSNAEAYGSGLYSPRANADTYAELLRLAQAELTTGRSVIIDASFKNQAARLQFAALAERFSAEFIILQVTCSDPEIRRRLVDRSTGGQSVSDGRLELLDQQQKEFELPENSEGKIIVLSTTNSPAAQTSMIYARLG
ncbi:MAG TPA: AAA family ATPase [Desulfuromonadaceae bacterium]|jgi:hypothetical protein